ncbi:sodium:proton antiporter [Mucilaginibacter sp. RS28]|uniref:Sodium:proton antiporter n=1 Tax=Mucilaginibacter straminoryzae TaxID=2932774 RepID=A0A9X2BBB1_9SPHI|nr:sodium:proton antiporter [Mucilaginibacter straminoryzae]MCJ8209642.1 sodium:proton antiporter [Mucilaginibacter straminoryzae]
MDFREILTIIIVLAAVFAYVNHRFIKLPPTIGIMALSLISSLLIALTGNSRSILSEKAIELVSSVDFNDLLMNFMLSFLLFAGSIHVDASKLKAQLGPVALLALLGTVVSTLLVGGGMWYLFSFFGASIPLVYCLLFGALISPTDPVAVLGILKDAKIPESLELKISGESLFNDGVGVVLFITISEVARSTTGHFSWGETLLLFSREAIGGLVFGALLGYIGYLAIRSIDDYKVEVLITIALVLGGYLLADKLHVSGPLAMVVAGIITGNKVKHEAMSDVTRDYLGKFWELVDEILNAVLFLLIGLEILTIKTDSIIFVIGLLTIPLVLAIRWISVFFPLLLLRKWMLFEKNVVTILTWGGLRGGISVALALSLTKDMHRDEFTLITYVVVVFSILVQGLSIGNLAKKLQ